MITNMVNMKDINPMDAHRDETWVDYRWRPAAAWLYLATCLFDFIIAPVLWPILLASYHQPVTPWNPITLQGAGLYHLAMGAIVGITSWSRTQEKITSFNNNPFVPPMPGPYGPQPYMPGGGGMSDTTITTDNVTPVNNNNNPPQPPNNDPPKPILHPH